jgi:adenine-specific DNA-methyltransferase
MFDGFTGSGCVARLFKHYASELYANDLEAYSETINNCYLANKSEVAIDEVKELIDYLNEHKLDAFDVGFIEQHYAPKDDKNIKDGERVFYTNQNAKIIDNMRRLIRREVEGSRPRLFPFVVAPLLVKASIHNNTSGVFKGFHKKDGIGHFGGKGENALTRILGEIKLEYPLFCEHECPTKFIRGDINEVITCLPDLDVVYYDPPYNQHPYGSNYFMLNIINDYDNPAIQSGVSGIAEDWNKSDYNYNRKKEAEKAMDDLIAKTRAKYILISYNNEGIIKIGDFEAILNKYGKVILKEQEYNTYRGSKNLGKDKKLLSGEKKNIKVKELLWVLKK